jgi:DNA-binding NtrC family response regulator
VNVATANQARFSALLVESENKGGLEGALREQGCSVRRATSRAAAQEALEGTDVIVISAQGFSDDDVIDLINKAQGRSVLVVAESTDLAVKAAKQGAIVAGSFELASAQLTQVLSIVDLKRKARAAGPVSLTSPTSGVVQRRSTPLPKEATPDALEALIEAAECLVPMHRFQRVYVDYALRRFGGNKVHTAAALGIDRRTIQRWARARAEARPAAGPTTTATTNTTTSSSS